MPLDNDQIQNIENYNIKKPYFLSTIIDTQVPLVFFVYNYINQNIVEAPQVICEKFNLKKTGELDSITSFLRSVDLYTEGEQCKIERMGIIFNKNDPSFYEKIADRHIPIIYNFNLNLRDCNEFFKFFINEIKFKVLLLSKFCQLKSDNMWNKQAFFTLFYKYHILKKKLKINKPSLNDALYFKSINNYMLKHYNYAPLRFERNKKIMIKYGPKKVDILFALYEYLGLLKPDIDKKFFTITVDKNFLELLIILILSKHKDQSLDFETFFKSLERLIPYSYIDNSLKIPFPLAFAFYLLKIENKIDFFYDGDYKVHNFDLMHVLESKRLRDFNNLTHIKYIPKI
ncbi:MAG: hypothetical protein ACTSPD_18685 [Promethearchaeota archaeon]